jgi:tetratricopeptide (TPR) repeat protein
VTCDCHVTPRVSRSTSAHPGDPETPGDYLECGLTYEAAGQLSQAVVCFIRGLRARLTNVHLYTHLLSTLDKLPLPHKTEIANRLERLRLSVVEDRHASLLEGAAKAALIDCFWVLGNCLAESGFDEAALAGFEIALLGAPSAVQLLIQCSAILSRLDRGFEALELAARAVDLAPLTAEAHATHGLALLQCGRIVEAVAAYRKCVYLGKKHSRSFDFIIALACALGSAGELTEAISNCRQAIVLRPDDKYAHVALGFLLLKTGDFAEGLAEFEWRLEDKPVLGVRLPAPRWKGESLKHRSLLINSELGFGDTIQFFRYVQLLARDNCQTTLLCPKPLVPLLEANTTAKVVDQLPLNTNFDYSISMLSLPFEFGTRLETIPGSPHYLCADPVRQNGFRSRFANSERFKIGLVWASGRRLAHAHLDRGQKDRSIEFALFECLLDIPNSAFYNLQKDDSLFEATSSIESGELLDCTRELVDFADNAAFIANLDLVISVDTAVAHLTAALGKPVWILLNAYCDWRWLQDRDDSPWYPTARLFRQAQAGDWRPVIKRVREALAAFIRTTCRS